MRSYVNGATAFPHRQQEGDFVKNQFKRAIGLGSGEPGAATADPSPEGRFPLFLALVFSLITFVAAFVFASEDVAVVSVMVSLLMAAALIGALIGFLFGAPGMEPTADGLASGQAKGWGGRIGVISNWLAGAAFTLLITNGDSLLEAYLDVLRYATGAGGKTASTVETRSMVVAGSAMIAWFAIGFITGFLQMITNGRAVITSAEARAERRLALLRGTTSPIALSANPDAPLTSAVGVEQTVMLTINNRSEVTIRLNAASDTAEGLVVSAANATASAGPWSTLELTSGSAASAEVKVTPTEVGPFLLSLRANGSFLSQDLTLPGMAS